MAQSAIRLASHKDKLVSQSKLFPQSSFDWPAAYLPDEGNNLNWDTHLLYAQPAVMLDSLGLAAIGFRKKIQKDHFLKRGKWSVWLLKSSLFSYFRTTVRWSMTWRNSRNEMITALVVIQVTHTHSLNNWKNWKKYMYISPPRPFCGWYETYSSDN